MQVLNIFHVLIAIAMVALVLVQRGAGATAGAAFGSGASGTVFGSRGAGTFLTKSTWVLATLFCAISLTMAVMVSRLTAEPGTDLGVVATPATAAPQTEPAGSAEVLSNDADDPQNDLPTLQREDEALNNGAPPLQQAVDDLPTADAIATDPAVDGERPNLKVDSDGS